MAGAHTHASDGTSIEGRLESLAGGTGDTSLVSAQSRSISRSAGRIATCAGGTADIGGIAVHGDRPSGACCRLELIDVRLQLAQRHRADPLGEAVDGDR